MSVSFFLYLSYYTHHLIITYPRHSPTSFLGPRPPRHTTGFPASRCRPSTSLAPRRPAPPHTQHPTAHSIRLPFTRPARVNGGRVVRRGDGWAFAASLTRVFGSLTRNRPTSHTPHHSLAWLGLSSFCVSSPRLTRYSVRASLSLLALLVVPKGRSLPTGFALTLPQPLGTRVTHPLSSRYTSLGSATRFVLRVSLHGPSGPRFTRRSLSLVAPFLATLVLRPSGPRSLVTKGV